MEPFNREKIDSGCYTSGFVNQLVIVFTLSIAEHLHLRKSFSIITLSCIEVDME